MTWTCLCKRTEDPKLHYIEMVLAQRGVQSRRNGDSWHAPILEVPEADHETAWALLGLQARRDLGLPVRYGVTIDDVPDDHACFALYADDPIPCTEVAPCGRCAECSEHADPVRDGWVGKDGRP
jgi:hypothetical protein